MSKLPSDFVKAPAAQPAPRARRARKTTLVAAAAEAPRDPRELLLRLTDDEHQALEEARQSMLRAGQEVTLEQILHRVLADWTLRLRTPPAPAPAPAPTAQAAQAPHDERLLDRLRAMAATPLKTWRELGATLRRLSRLPLR